MNWQGTDNDCVFQRTSGGAKAHRYYYVYEERAGRWIAGRYAFGREIDFKRKTFLNSASARAYCEKIDREAVVIEAVTV